MSVIEHIGDNWWVFGMHHQLGGSTEDDMNKMRVIGHISLNKIGEREGQGRTFRFLIRQKQAYEWMDEVPEDNDGFQELLEDKVEAAPYPDIRAELPEVELDKEKREFQMIPLEEPEPDF